MTRTLVTTNGTTAGTKVVDIDESGNETMVPVKHAELRVGPNGQRMLYLIVLRAVHKITFSVHVAAS